jgi:hypothetical protein
LLFISLLYPLKEYYFKIQYVCNRTHDTQVIMNWVAVARQDYIQQDLHICGMSFKFKYQSEMWIYSILKTNLGLESGDTLMHLMKITQSNKSHASMPSNYRCFLSLLIIPFPNVLVIITIIIWEHPLPSVTHPRLPWYYGNIYHIAYSLTITISGNIK